MTVREWWDTKASGDDQRAVLIHLKLSIGFAGVPWAFLPNDVRKTLEPRIRIAPDNTATEDIS